MGEGVAGAQAEVAIDGQGGLATKRDGALAATLAQADYDLVVQVEVVGEHPAASDMRTPVSMNSRMIAVSRRLVESRRWHDFSRRRSWSSVSTGSGLSGSWGWLHADHRAPFEFAFGEAPLEQRLDAAVAVQGGGRLPAFQLVGDEVADIRAFDRVPGVVWVVRRQGLEPRTR
jgi:hypothetical protein